MLEPLPPDFAITNSELEAKYGDRDDVIMEVHIGGSTPKWDNYKTKRERMIEISSGFGNAEWMLQKALKVGYRPAVCGCSDLHMGLMGGPRSVEPFRGRFRALMNITDSGYGTGPLTAVMAPELTREQIWHGMTQRATYATTGARIFIDFRCNGRAIGQEMKKGKRVELALECHGTEKIDRIDLISGDYMLHTWLPNALDFSATLDFAGHDVPGDWIYLRVHQVDENFAWTTPIWLDSDYPRWNATERHLEKAAGPGNEAAAYLADVINYLTLEEDITLFKDITPVGIIEQLLAKCALFYCYYGDGHPMAIRWYFEYEIPKIRMDWGWRDFGVKDDEVKQKLF
jgi:hypothetical protein